MKFFKRMFSGVTEQAPVVTPAAVEAPVVATIYHGPPGTRIYHEYFVGEPRHDGKFPWNCRVYAPDGTITEIPGVADTRQAADDAAGEWAASTKATIRGAA
jgi:hypothetical protein